MGRPSYALFVTRTVPGFPEYHVAVADTTPVYSNVFSPDPGGRVGFDLETTGTLAGGWTLWYSNAPEPSLADDTDWEEDAAWAPTDPAGSGIKNSYALTDLKVRRARLKFTATAGSGNVSGNVNV